MFASNEPMKRTDAVKMIFMIIRDYGHGLPRAVEIFNYVTAYGATPATEKNILLYLLKSGFYAENEIQ